MNQNHIVRERITIHARSATIWNALTTPELTKQYFFKSEIHSSWQVGDPLTFTRKFFGLTLTLRGILEQIEPERLLQYKLMNTKIFGKPAAHEFSRVSIQLSEQNGQTIVAVSDDVGSYEGAEKRYKRSVKGWHTILSGLKKLAERMD